jgi:hypothetical protein
MNNVESWQEAFDASQRKIKELEARIAEMAKGEPVGYCIKPTKYALDAGLVRPHKREFIQGELNKSVYWEHEYPIFTHAVPVGMQLVPINPTDAMISVLTDMLTACFTVEESYQDLLIAAKEELK